MGTGRTLNKAPKTRPKKSEGERRRREKNQQRRLVELGMAPEEVAKMNGSQLRAHLKRPAAIQGG